MGKRGPKKNKWSDWRNKYHDCKRRAKRRGISWELTFDQWRDIWLNSGHWKDRGRNAGQYVMGRFGDKGPYSPENVRIITHADNTREAWCGKKHGENKKRLMKGNKYALGNKSNTGVVFST